MKTAIKVLSILSLIGAAIGVFTTSILLIMTLISKDFMIDFIIETLKSDPNFDPTLINETLIRIVFNIVIVFMVVAIALAAVAIVNDALILKKLSKGTNKKEMLVHAILAIIFSNLITGILLLVVKDSDLY